MPAEQVIKQADFNPRVCTYWLLSGAIVFIVTIVGIPFLLLWFPFGLIFTKRYLDRMECVLTDKALKVKKGILVRTEKTIPLAKITDMGMVQGPIMRSFDLHTLTVETAGQSGTGALVSLTGIVDAPAFREAVLNQRDVNSPSSSSAGTPIETAVSSDAGPVLADIRDTLVRIEKMIEQASDR